MSKLKFIAAITAAIVAALAITACGDDNGSSSASSSTGGLPQGSESVKLDPADFSTTIDNPYWPMAVGSRWVSRETDPTGAKERVVLTATNRTKTVAAGIETRVITDVVTDENGDPVETTDDWYAQDKDGNVWYFGEDVKNYENGKFVDREGSWEAGVDGAQAGIAMPADPKPGLTYRQEYYKGVAEDRGGVITVGQERVNVPAGFFQGVLMTRDTVPLEPKVQELKFFARNVGPLLSVHTDTGGGRAELVSYKPAK